MSSPDTTPPPLPPRVIAARPLARTLLTATGENGRRTSLVISETQNGGIEIGAGLHAAETRVYIPADLIDEVLITLQGIADLRPKAQEEAAR